MLLPPGAIFPNVYTLVTYDGQRRVVPSSIAGVWKIGERIEREVSVELMPAARAAFERGERLCFDDVELDVHALWLGKLRLPWHNLRAIGVSLSALAFFRRGSASPCAVVRIADVPHVRVLLGIVHGRATIVPW
jgi:hypothetical protein